MRSRVNRQEQVRGFAVGDRRARRQRHEVVGAPCQDHVPPWLLLQQLLEAQRDVEHQLGLGHAVAHGAGIVPAVAGVDHDARDAEAELARDREAAGHVGRRGAQRSEAAMGEGDAGGGARAWEIRRERQ